MISAASWFKRLHHLFSMNSPRDALCAFRCPSEMVPSGTTKKNLRLSPHAVETSQMSYSQAFAWRRCSTRGRKLPSTSSIHAKVKCDGFASAGPIALRFDFIQLSRVRFEHSRSPPSTRRRRFDLNLAPVDPRVSTLEFRVSSMCAANIPVLRSDWRRRTPAQLLM